jgi:hypothetical protein
MSSDKSTDLKTKIITIRISEDLYNFIKKESSNRSVSVGELFREKFVDGETITARLTRIEEKLDSFVGGS